MEITIYAESCGRWLYAEFVKDFYLKTFCRK